MNCVLCGGSEDVARVEGRAGVPLCGPCRDAKSDPLPFQSHSLTSILAAESALGSAAGMRRKVLAFITEHGPVTDEGIAHGLGLNPSTARPRRIELQRAGLIEPFGYGQTRAGRKAVAWKAAI